MSYSHLIRFRNLVPDISKITCKYLRLILRTYKSKNTAIFEKPACRESEKALNG